MPDNWFGFAGQLLRTVYLSLLLAGIPYYFNNLGGEIEMLFYRKKKWNIQQLETSLSAWGLSTSYSIETNTEPSDACRTFILLLQIHPM